VLFRILSIGLVIFIIIPSLYAVYFDKHVFPKVNKEYHLIWTMSTTKIAYPIDFYFYCAIKENITQAGQKWKVKSWNAWNAGRCLG